jgi:hypothetical protein
MFSHLIGRAGTDEEIKALADYTANASFDEAKKRAELVGLMLASPAFQMF